MPLVLHYHPLSSFCHKVLIALYELELPFEPRLLNLGDAAAVDAYRKLWPTAKMPLLEDDGRVVPETSIIIEHLARRVGGTQRLLPLDDAQPSLDVRLWDRLFDHYVMHPMQAIVADRIRGEADRDPLAVSQAREKLVMAYGMIEQRLTDGRTWIAGEAFTMADCAAAPSLFYAETLVHFPADRPKLKAYYDRLLERPSVARTLEEATPFFQYYPYREALPVRFRNA
ncbi:glutathione S-transferase family protein [Caenimonas sedimenti]|uniref:Glutathione S-transferase family protein n=1 Tax=Caenimonas sedimenti TaxID=2596921 RepID=A0A562ZXD9_9BURK|nr:glutathione S-transferase family protein [Caenimonas sedimenti]TWO73027.1 glutathione S-transferase family protein [Caenimonas sedimenti]